MATFSKPALSSEFLICPTLPSIMSEGATISKPDSAAITEDLHKTSTVKSLSTFPKASKIPSWPWSVKGSSARSAINNISGKFSLIFLAAR